MKNPYSLIFIFTCSIYSVFAETAAAVTPTKDTAKLSSSLDSPSVIEILMEASLIVQLTMLVLAIMSVVSWGIIFNKWNLFKANNKQNAPFEDIFFKAASLDEIFDTCKLYPNSSLATVFRAGYSELKKIAASKQQSDSSRSLLSGMDNLQRSLNKAVNNETLIMESRLSFLATTGSVSPFIGLFGTVFGIMTSFQQIGAQGSASLAVVAPGISEALIATGFGLFAAIPAAVFYNHFINEIKKMEIQFNNFITDFLNISKRNFFK